MASDKPNKLVGGHFHIMGSSQHIGCLWCRVVPRGVRRLSRRQNQVPVTRQSAEACQASCPRFVPVLGHPAGGIQLM